MAAKKSSKAKTAKASAKRVLSGRVSKKSQEPTRRNGTRTCRIIDKHATFNFKGLPAEIRKLVYGYTFEYVEKVTTVKSHYKLTALNIMLVDKQLHQEAADVMAKRTIACIQPPGGIYDTNDFKALTKTDENVLRNFSRVEFRELHFGGWKSGSTRIKMVDALKERLAVFVQGSRHMEQHRTRHATVNIFYLFWGDHPVWRSVLNHRQEEALSHWLECLKVMKSDPRTHWIIIAAPTNADTPNNWLYSIDPSWLNVKGWNEIEKAYQEWGFNVVTLPWTWGYRYY